MREIVRTRFANLLPSRDEWRRSWGAIWRGTGIGFGLGLIPGIGAIVPTFMAYIAEKRLSKTPERFGHGAIEGVAAPETANNAYANAAMVPFLTLGIPSSPTIAVLMGAFIVNGLTPGPVPVPGAPRPRVGGDRELLRRQRDPARPQPAARRAVGEDPARAVSSTWRSGVLLFCLLGAYSLQQSVFDVWVMIAFGVVGYVLRKLDLPLAPLMLGLILGPAIEKSLRTSLEMSGGDFGIFFTRPAVPGPAARSAAVLVAAALKLAPSQLRDGVAP